MSTNLPEKISIAQKLRDEMNMLLQIIDDLKIPAIKFAETKSRIINSAKSKGLVSKDTNNMEQIKKEIKEGSSNINNEFEKLCEINMEIIDELKKLIKEYSN